MDYWRKYESRPGPLSFEGMLTWGYLQVLYPNKSAFIKAVLVTIEAL